MKRRLLAFTSVISSLVMSSLVMCAIWTTVTQASIRSAGSTFPPPVQPTARGALSECPNPAGLQSWTGATSKQAVTDALEYGHESLAVDLGHSDRAWRPQVRTMWKFAPRPQPADGQASSILTRTAPAGSSPYRSIITRSCGIALIRHSLTVTAGPKTNPQCQACLSTFFFIKRNGIPELYYIQ